MNVLFFLLALLLGVGAGKVGTPRSLVENSNKVLTTLIYILLFVVGIEVGGQREVLSDLKEIGLQSATICAGAVLGSGLLSQLTASSGRKEDGI